MKIAVISIRVNITGAGYADIVHMHHLRNATLQLEVSEDKNVFFSHLNGWSSRILSMNTTGAWGASRVTPGFEGQTAYFLWVSMASTALFAPRPQGPFSHGAG